MATVESAQQRERVAVSMLRDISRAPHYPMMSVPEWQRVFAEMAQCANMCSLGEMETFMASVFRAHVSLGKSGQPDVSVFKHALRGLRPPLPDRVQEDDEPPVRTPLETVEDRFQG